MNNAKIHLNYLEDYEKSLSTLEDIQLLSEFSLAPLIGRVYFHISEMKRKADAGQLSLVNPFHKVNEVLEEKFQNIISDFFSSKPKYKSFEYIKKVEKIDLKKWNAILAMIPEVLSVVSLFNFHGTVTTYLDEAQFLVSGLILEEGQVELSRKIIYSITRKLLKEKILLTFKIHKSDRTGLFKLELRADISHDEELLYKTKFNRKDQESYLIGFSNVFQNYRASIEDIAHSGEHNIIELKNDLTINHYVGIPDFESLEFSRKEILHFSFIFRPVSIILPMRGSIVKDSSLRNSSKSFVEDHREHDVSKYYQTIDFFSLFNL